MRSVIIITLLALRTVIAGFMHAGRWLLLLLLYLCYVGARCVYCFSRIFLPLP